jgi:hypothetical protein
VERRPQPIAAAVEEAKPTEAAAIAEVSRNSSHLKYQAEPAAIEVVKPKQKQQPSKK